MIEATVDAPADHLTLELGEYAKHLELPNSRRTAGLSEASNCGRLSRPLAPETLSSNIATTLADVAADLVGASHVDLDRSLITAAEDFAYIICSYPGAFINIGNASTVDSCPVHNPHYEIKDAALPLEASSFARLVEKKFPRISDN
jgi:metal-dependent amidase/aminoacylase/carboxypeptidase family protein